MAVISVILLRGNNGLDQSIEAEGVRSGWTFLRRFESRVNRMC